MPYAGSMTLGDIFEKTDTLVTACSRYSVSRLGRYGGRDRPHYVPTGKERPVLKKLKMPGLVKIAEKREHAGIARVKASVPSKLVKDVGFP
jgi:hypothetical protein